MHFFACEETQDAYPIVEADKNRIAVRLLENLGCIIVAIVVVGVATALDEDPDWKFGSDGGVARLEDIDEEAIFAIDVAGRIMGAYT